MQKAFLFDVNKCTGCDACHVACSIENQLEPGVSWRRVHTFNPRHVPGVPSFHHSLACNHCVDPPCMKHCPALAYSKDPVTGAVTIDAEKCIGCKYCSWACPYDAPQFNRGTGTVEKCTFCTHRLDDGLEPACVALCPTGALQFGDHTPGGGDRVPGFTATEIEPAIRFVPLRKSLPEASADAGVTSVPGRPGGGATGRIALRSEWTLMVFSLLAAFLVGAFASTLVESATSVFDRPRPFNPVAFALAGAFGLALSALHLGRRTRAWRAVLNLRGSWLSREVLLFPAFLTLATASLAAADSGGAVRWIAAALGLAALFAVDSVYHVTRTPALWLHSAQVFLTGLLFAGLFAANGIVFAMVAVVKTFLYLWRKYNFFRERREARPWLTRARVLVGLAGPLVLWWKGAAGWYAAVVAGVLLGEIIDRCEFYLELDAPSPAGQMDADLAVVLTQPKG
jgi:DMSO reductase iron-sulfur subunit